MRLKGSTVIIFFWTFVFYLAADGLWKLHQLGQPVSALIAKALGFGVLLAVLDWLRSGAGKKI